MHAIGYQVRETAPSPSRADRPQAVDKIPERRVAALSLGGDAVKYQKHGSNRLAAYLYALAGAAALGFEYEEDVETDEPRLERSGRRLGTVLASREVASIVADAAKYDRLGETKIAAFLWSLAGRAYLGEPISAGIPRADLTMLEAGTKFVAAGHSALRRQDETRSRRED